jgi:hypothetical protein
MLFEVFGALTALPSAKLTLKASRLVLCIVVAMLFEAFGHQAASHASQVVV